MPRVEIPNVGEVDFPDTMTPEELNAAAARIHQQYADAAKPTQAAPEESPSISDYIVDAAKGAPGALQRGLAAIGGIGGDIREAAESGLEWAGLSPEAADRVTNRAAGTVPVFAGPTSDQINNLADTVTGGLPRSQYAPGQAAEAVLEAAPMMMTGGMGPLRATGTALAMHGSGEAAKFIDPRLEAPAEIVTGIASGFVGGKRLPKYTGGKTLSELDDLSSSMYDELSGLAPSAKTAMTAKAKVAQALAKSGYKPRWHTGINEWLGKVDDVVDDVVNKRAPVDFDDFKELRGGQLESVFKNGTKTERRLAYAAQEALDDVLQNADAFRGLPSAAKAAVFQKYKMETLGGLRDLIENRQNYHNTSDFAKALKREMQLVSKRMAKDTTAGRRLKSQFTPRQRAVIDKIAKGKDMPDVAKTLRNYSPTNAVAGPQNTVVGVIWSLMEGNPIPALVVGGSQAAGAGAKAFANARARSNWAQLESMATGAQRTPWTSRAGAAMQYPIVGGAAGANMSRREQ